MKRQINKTKEREMKELVEYFTKGITTPKRQTVGAEVETQFVDENGEAIQTSVSQQIFGDLAGNGWEVTVKKGDMITDLKDSRGNKIFYELGRQNLEVSTIACEQKDILDVTRGCLNQLYASAKKFGAQPYFKPILPGDEDLLVIPDERDAAWLELDGRAALAPLARTSSVQFTVSVDPQKAIWYLNCFGKSAATFMHDYPQDQVWKDYISNSKANYRADRYGGPLLFESLEDYCNALTKHDVVVGTKLVPYAQAKNIDIPLYLRSIWWQFRLKRYKNTLCIEARPTARRDDSVFEFQLGKVFYLGGLRF